MQRFKTSNHLLPIIIIIRHLSKGNAYNLPDRIGKFAIKKLNSNSFINIKKLLK